MFKRLLVLLDGSKLAEIVFSYARELSGRLKLDLDLLHVCNPNESEQLPMREAYIQHMAELLQAQSEELGRKFAGSSPGRRIETRGQVVVGYPAEEILKYSESNPIDLLMLSTHGSSGIRRWGLGSVADKVIHETRLPVWLVPAQLRDDILYDKLPQRTILIPLDGSKLDESILPVVQDLVKQRGEEMELILINVAKEAPSLSSAWGGQGSEMRDSLSSMRTAGEVYLNGVAARLIKSGLKVRIEQLVGDPAEEIVRYAAQYHPLNIAMSTHGRSGLSRFVFEGDTEAVMHRLQKTPLLLVRPQE